MKKKFIVVICGPTATGKTSIAVSLAQKFGGEIISADSMQIYKGMEIATAKPTKEEMQGVPHYLMDFYDPCDSFSVADYVRLAREKTDEVSARGKIPFIVGGTGLYISSLVNNINFEDSECDYEYREQLRLLAREKGGSYLLSRLAEFDPETAAALHPNNLARIIRAMEVYKVTGKTMSELQWLSRSKPSPYEPCMIALDYDRDLLYERINKRVDIMLAEGLIKEAREFFEHDNYPTAVQAIGYKELFPYFTGEKDLAECVESLKRETRKYAKRQLTWFRRDSRINWIKVTRQVSRREIVETAESVISAAIEEYNGENGTD